jgi:hypothetical protein
MCEQGEGPKEAVRHFFKPDVKCCTYEPHLPNYLVGAVLADPDPALDEGRRRLRARIASRIGTTPQFVAPPRKVNVLMRAARGSQWFGRSEAIVCPYLDREGGKCTVWRHRDAVCSTWFCKYAGGARGYAYWTALRDYMGFTELKLASWAARKIEPTSIERPGGRYKLSVEDLEDRAPSDAEYARCWGAYVGREEELYVATFEAVRALTREEFRSIVDEANDGKKWLDELEARYAALHSTVLPATLVRNPKMRVTPISGAQGGGMIVSTYSRFDPFALDADLYDVLRHFTAEESVEATLAKLAAQGIELQPELLFALYAQGVLVPPGGDAPEEQRAGGAASET